MTTIDLGPIRDLAPRIPITRRVGVGRPPAAEGKGPSKIDFFEITSAYQSDKFVRDAEAHKVVGEQPKRLNIRLLSDDPNDSLVVRHQLWVGARMRCEGNGEQAIRGGKVIECHASRERWADRDPMEVARLKKEAQESLPPAEKQKRLALLDASLARDNPTAPVRCFFAQIDQGCKVTSSLIFEIDNLPGLNRFRSHGMATGRELMTSMQLMLRETGGVLRGLPLALVVKWQRVTTPDGKSVGAPIVHLEARAWGELKSLAAVEISTRRGLESKIMDERRLLQAVHADVDGEAVAAEFTDAATVLEMQAQDKEKPSGGMR